MSKRKARQRVTREHLFARRLNRRLRHPCARTRDLFRKEHAEYLQIVRVFDANCRDLIRLAQVPRDLLVGQRFVEMP